MKGFIIFRNDEVWEADESLLSPVAVRVDDETTWQSLWPTGQRYRWVPEPDEEDK